jgi:hypothetical protein
MKQWECQGLSQRHFPWIRSLARIDRVTDDPAEGSPVTRIRQMLDEVSRVPLPRLLVPSRDLHFVTHEDLRTNARVIAFQSFVASSPRGRHGHMDLRRRATPMPPTQ